jgi:hypothetical protein
LKFAAPCKGGIGLLWEAVYSFAEFERLAIVNRNFGKTIFTQGWRVGEASPHEKN